MEDLAVALVQTDSPQFRVDTSYSQLDMMLVQFDINGKTKRVLTFTLGDNAFDMLAFPQNLVVTKGERYYMAGSYFGFQTRY